MTPLTIFRLVTATLLPVLVAVLFYLAEKKTRFGNISNKVKQGIIGITFGIVAILATEFGIPVDGAVLNVRNAAPLTAGLIFGWPAGIISGLLGGIERWFSHAGDFTRMACTIGTIVSGFLGASVRRFLMDNKKASWFYGLVVGITSEVLHMLMVFLTNSADIQRAFNIVQIVAIPMIFSNGVSVMLAILCVSLLGKSTNGQTSKMENISQTFQRWLLLCVMFAFIVTSVFTFSFQTQIANATAEVMLQTNIQDVRNDIRDTSNRNLLKITHEIKESLSGSIEKEELVNLTLEYDVSEISIIDENGIIVNSSDETLVGFDMSSGKQAAEFLVLLDGTEEVVQDYQAISKDSSVYRKYAGVAMGTGFLQVGYDTTHFYQQIDEQVKYVAQNRHIGQSGCIIICDNAGRVVSGEVGHIGELISVFDSGNGVSAQEETCFHAQVFGEKSYCMYTDAEGYYILGVMKATEALFSRNASVYMLAFMEVIVFAVLFVFIFVLIKKLVVENVQRINSSLEQITGGNLEVLVDVRTNEEFASLSDDINSTVDTLKRYIAEAAARIDKELKIAKKIQHSALPSDFSPNLMKNEFSIFATMDTAKEVGGDFYDFYMLDKNRLAFLIADVSGKGIPAAMFMMNSKTLIKGFAENGMEVNDVFTAANEKLCEGNDADMFVTAWMGVLDLTNGMISYANAGHNPPVIRRKDGSYEYLKAKRNFVLAGMKGVVYKKFELQLQPGDEIYLYTDGVTEAQNLEKQLYGEERLLSCLNECNDISVEDICKKVRKDVELFVGDADQFDDITMLSIRLNQCSEE